MATITTNTTITLPAGQMLVFGLGGSATAIIDGNVYELGLGEKFFGPFTQTESVQVVVRAGTITYNIEADGFASRDILQDPISRQLTPDSADAVRGAVQPLVPSASYVCMVPCRQAAGTGSAKGLIKGVLSEIYHSSATGRGTLTDAQMWANAGYITTVAGAGGQAEFPVGAVPIRFDQAGYLIGIGIKASAPGAVSAFFGQGNSSAGLQGLSLRADTAGKIQLLVVTSAGTFNVGTTNGVYFDGADHHLALFVHPSGYVAFFRDGEIDTTFTSNNAYPIGSINETSPLTIGGAVANNGTAIAGQWRGVHVIRFDELPLNLGAIARKMASAVYDPIGQSDIVFAGKTVGLFWAAGQSNEAGSGNTPGMTGAIGVPHRDASSAGRSVISGLSYALASRGVGALWASTAFGTTAITDSWCGRIRNWVSGLNVVSGSYVLSGGVVYKCTNSNGFAGSSTTTPAVGTGADGVMWASLGAPTADDTATLSGTGVYSQSSPRWDPNGWLATAVAKFSMIKPLVDQVVGIVSIGQTDRYVGSTAAQYSDAIQKVANYHLANGAHRVLIGMTVRSAVTVDYSAANGGGAQNAANTTSDAWYDANLIPGRAAALAALAGNPAVAAGHDWVADIGVVTSQAYATGVGVKSSDLVHMTDAAYETKAVPSMSRALESIGL